MTWGCRAAMKVARHLLSWTGMFRALRGPPVRRVAAPNEGPVETPVPATKHTGLLRESPTHFAALAGAPPPTATRFSVTTTTPRLTEPTVARRRRRARWPKQLAVDT
jgi:hypothetical protein